LLEQHEIEFEYREYRNEPLSAEEIRTLLNRLGLSAADVLRRRDRAFKEAGLSGEESEKELICAMAQHPTLLQRPIGVLGGRAMVGRPVENLLTLVEPG